MILGPQHSLPAMPSRQEPEVKDCFKLGWEVVSFVVVVCEMCSIMTSGRDLIGLSPQRERERERERPPLAQELASKLISKRWLASRLCACHFNR